MSKQDENSEHHPSLRCASRITQICRPLQQLTAIDYFAHVRVDKSGQFTALGQNPDFVKKYLDKQYYNADVHLLDEGPSEEYVIQDNVSHTDKTSELFADCTQHALHHIFSIIFRNKNSTNVYHFATNQYQTGFNEVYLRHLTHLKKFIMHFNAEVQADSQLSEAYQIPYQIKKSRAQYHSKYYEPEIKSALDTVHFSLRLKRYYLPNQESVYLTNREFEVLRLLHSGKTAPKISIILHISERTVREHINNVREKLNCTTLFQLGEKFAQLSMFNLEGVS